MRLSHPGFQILIPDSLVVKVKGLSPLEKVNPISLIGLWKKNVGHGGAQDSLTQSFTLCFLGLGVSTGATGGTKGPHQLTGPSSTHPSLIGQLTLSSRGRDVRVAQGPVAQRDNQSLPPSWISLHIWEEDWSVTVVEIWNENELLFPHPPSLFFMYFDPEVVKYLRHVKISALPALLLQGFISELPSSNLRQKVIPLLPNFKESEKIEQSTGFQKPRDLRDKNEWKIWRSSCGLTQGIHVLNSIKKVICGPLTGLEIMNLVVMLALDLLLGFIFTSYLTQFPHLYSTLHSKIQRLLEILLQLLNWLRGSPAGLKLNSALNSLLWRFFSYHLHLWANYIGILEPILTFMLVVIIKAGCLGFTVQISLIKDLLSIATFHVYCLYIYATRLFSVQLIAIKSLGRLFLGRKWNPLRNRVDHVHLSKSEIFLSALGFTIGIFLAPTTIIYYTVFLSLRLPVLVLESTLIHFVKTMNSCQIVTNLLILVNSPRVSDEIYLKPVPNVIHTFRICLLTTKRVFRLPPIAPAIANVLQSICQGKVLSR